MKFDPTRLEIFKNLFHSVAEEMGAALRRAAFSSLGQATLRFLTSRTPGEHTCPT
jgi:N-methylhydantoinase B/oxoprolinase/acetone carboxylase alpha subunit